MRPFAAPVLAAVLLVWLPAARFNWIALGVAFLALPAILLLAPSPAELGVTMAIEGAIVWALAAAFGIARWRALLLSLFVNGLTQPLLYIGVTALAPTFTTWRRAVAIGETLVWIVEGLLYLACLGDLRRSRWAPLKVFGLSLAANAASAAAGLLLPS